MAKTSNVIRGKIGAILFKDNGHIITKSSNAIIMGSDKEHSIHAEQFLLLKATKLRAFDRFVDLNILVVRWRKGDNKLGNAKPCKQCTDFLKTASQYLNNIYYSDVDGNISSLDI